MDLVPLVGTEFVLPCEDPWLTQAGTRGHAYLDAAGRQWQEHPDFMDFLALDSPVYDLKAAERDLYLHYWKPHLSARRVLDVGCGIGRMSMPFLDRGASVVGVDGDLKSLQRMAWHSAGRPGRLDLRWASATSLPDEGDFDVVIACEVLCYVPNVEPVLAELFGRLRPGGALLLSWEAPYGWAAATDAPPSSLAQALHGPGELDLPGDRWVRTLDRAGLQDLLIQAGFTVDLIEATHYTLDGPLEGCLDDSISLESMIETEAACRAHPVWGPLNRIWTAVAHRPDQAMTAP